MGWIGRSTPPRGPKALIRGRERPIYLQPAAGDDILLARVRTRFRPNLRLLRTP